MQLGGAVCGPLHPLGFGSLSLCICCILCTWGFVHAVIAVVTKLLSSSSLLGSQTMSPRLHIANVILQLRQLIRLVTFWANEKHVTESSRVGPRSKFLCSNFAYLENCPKFLVLCQKHYKHKLQFGQLYLAYTVGFRLQCSPCS